LYEEGREHHEPIYRTAAHRTGDPGAGIPGPEAFFLRHMGVPLLSAAMPWGYATRRFHAAGPHRRGPGTHSHPWAGPLTAHRWLCLGAIHQALHRRQTGLIVKHLKKGERR
jgi:hypothetical protein